MKIKQIVKVLISITICLLLVGCSSNTSKKAVDSKNGWKPNGTVNLIVPSTPGGGHDTSARVWAKMVREKTGVRINIVNNGAGGGAVAFAEIMNAQPNGMTLGQLGSALVTDQYIITGCTYTPDSYRYVGIPSGDDYHLVVSSKGKFKDMDLQEFLEYAKNNPVTMASTGAWGQLDASSYLIQKASGAKFTRVGIKGGAACTLAVVAGDVDVTLSFPTEIIGQVKAGNLKILAHLGESRNNFFPETPTFKEKGYNIHVPSFKAIVLPKNTPDDIYKGWLEIFKVTMDDSKTFQEFEAVNMAPKKYIGEDSYKYIMQTHDFFKKIIDDGGAK